MRNQLFKPGLVCIIIGFVGLVITPYFLLLGVPVFIIGVVLVIFSRKPLKAKLYVTIGPILLYAPLTIIFQFAAINLSNLYTKLFLMTEQTFLIPENFEGEFRIVYNEKCGIEPKIENSHRLIEIPSNGVLILKTKYSYHDQNEYYLVDIAGHRTKINQTDYGKISKGQIPVVMPLTGEGTANMNDKTEYVFSDFYLCNKDTAYPNLGAFNEKFDELTDSLVKTCRNLGQINNQ